MALPGGQGWLDLFRDVTSEVALNRALAEAANTDHLTRLLNRRGGELAIAREVARARRDRSPLAFAMFDVDRFKRINDTLGHGAGDRVIAAVTAAVSASVRGYDLPIRWGGEEVLVVLPGAELADARTVSERVRAAVAAIQLEGIPPVTISAGVALLSPQRAQRRGGHRPGRRAAVPGQGRRPRSRLRLGFRPRGPRYSCGSMAPPKSSASFARVAEMHGQGNRRSKDDWELYRRHRERLTRTIDGVGQAVGPGAPPGGRLCLLGAGNCNDVQLDALAQRFGTIHLVDIDGAALDRARARQQPEVRARLVLHPGVDLTGLLGQLDAWGGEEPDLATQQKAIDAGAAAATQGAARRRLRRGGVLLPDEPARLEPGGRGRGGWHAAGRASSGRRRDPSPTVGVEIRLVMLTIHLRTLAALVRPGGAALLASDITSSDLYPLDDLGAGRRSAGAGRPAGARPAGGLRRRQPGVDLARAAQGSRAEGQLRRPGGAGPLAVDRPVRPDLPGLPAAAAPQVARWRRRALPAGGRARGVRDPVRVPWSIVAYFRPAAGR